MDINIKKKICIKVINYGIELWENFARSNIKLIEAKQHKMLQDPQVFGFSILPKYSLNYKFHPSIRTYVKGLLKKLMERTTNSILILHCKEYPHHSTTLADFSWASSILNEKEN